MKLKAEPRVALCDEKVNICISELPPLGKVKIDASMRFPWAKSVLFQSFAFFTADANGIVDLSRQKPDRGSYDFIDSMGLIVSMKPQKAKEFNKVGHNISVDNSLFIDFVVQCDQEISKVKLERLFMAKEVKSQKISDGFVGVLFYTENTSNKTIVWLGGSGSNLAINSPIASLLASHSFNVLSLPYFGEKGLPAKLSEIPLEYFDRVFDWVKKSPITTGKAVYLLGMSKGAELSLILASRYSFIKKMALWAPHAFCFQGLAFKNVSSWTSGGKPLPYIRIKNRWILSDMISCIIKNEPFGFMNTYKKALDVAKNKDAARIKVEDAQADLLIFTNPQNNIWNSYDGCTLIMETLRKTNYRNKYDMVVHENAGETFYAPYIIPYGDAKIKIAPRLTFSLGGTMEGNAHLQADSWTKTIDFFKN
jgi:Acyl-CoA thioester hydrolase/BAAT N-terminal region/BAAT / Acyl-CoA thioester hydrolase C terminal